MLTAHVIRVAIALAGVAVISLRVVGVFVIWGLCCITSVIVGGIAGGMIASCEEHYRANQKSDNNRSKKRFPIFVSPFLPVMT